MTPQELEAQAAELTGRLLETVSGAHVIAGAAALAYATAYVIARAITCNPEARGVLLGTWQSATEDGTAAAADDEYGGDEPDAKAPTHAGTRTVN